MQRIMCNATLNAGALKWDEPITMPDDVIPATNIYDMRITQHEDGYITAASVETIKKLIAKNRQ